MIWRLCLHLAKKLTGRNVLLPSRTTGPWHISDSAGGCTHTILGTICLWWEAEIKFQGSQFLRKQTSNMRVTSTEHPGWQHCWKSTPILSDSGVYAFPHCNRRLWTFLTSQPQENFGFFNLHGKATFYFQLRLGNHGGGEEMQAEESPPPGCVVIYCRCWFSFCFLLFTCSGELQTGRQTWRFSSYLNRTVWGLYTQFTVIGNHSYHRYYFKSNATQFPEPWIRIFPSTSTKDWGQKGPKGRVLKHMDLTDESWQRITTIASFLIEY